MLLTGRALVGLLLLVLGRRLYWLVVAGIGFLYGLELAPRLLPGRSETVIVIVALALALVGALVAVAATKAVLGLIGFAAGGGIAVLLLGNLSIDSGAVALGVFVIGGLLGAVLLLVLFDWTLIALSSLAGGSLIVTSAQRLVEIPPIAATTLVLVLAVVGALIQTRLWPARRSSR